MSYLRAQQRSWAWKLIHSIYGTRVLAAIDGAKDQGSGNALLGLTCMGARLKQRAARMLDQPTPDPRRQTQAGRAARAKLGDCASEAGRDAGGIASTFGGAAHRISMERCWRPARMEFTLKKSTHAPSQSRPDVLEQRDTGTALKDVRGEVVVIERRLPSTNSRGSRRCTGERLVRGAARALEVLTMIDGHDVVGC